MRNITQYIICDSMTPPGVSCTFDDLRVRDRLDGKRGIGYHYVIESDGTIIQGRELSEPGNVFPATDRTAVYICLVGSDGRFSQPQFDSLDECVSMIDVEIFDEYEDRDLPAIEALSEHDLWSTAPGFDVQQFFADRGF